MCEPITLSIVRCWRYLHFASVFFFSVMDQFHVVFDFMQLSDGCSQIFSARGCSAPTCTPLATNRPVAPMLKVTNPLKYSVYCTRGC